MIDLPRGVISRFPFDTFRERTSKLIHHGVV